MDRTREQNAEAREHAAHRLELSALKIEDGRISGTVKGFGVSLEGEAPFHTCVIDLGSALPIAKLVLQPGDLNHPDAVETGDANFDEAMQVLAQPGLAPTVQKILSDPEIRAALLTFLRLHPDCVVSGRSLRLHSKQPIDHRLILEAVEVAKALTAKFADLGFVETEERPKLPANRYTEREARELRSKIVGGALGLLGSGLIVAKFFDLPIGLPSVIVGLVAAIGLWSVGRAKK